MEIKLNNGMILTVAKNPYDKEICVYLKTASGNFWRDIAIIRPDATDQNIEVLLWKDENKTIPIGKN